MPESTAAAAGVAEVLKNPPPVCHLSSYGAGSTEYLLWFWIANAAVGPTADERPFDPVAEERPVG